MKQKTTQANTILAALNYLIQKQRLQPEQIKQLILTTIKENNESTNNDR